MSLQRSAKNYGVMYFQTKVSCRMNELLSCSLALLGLFSSLPPCRCVSLLTADDVTSTDVGRGRFVSWSTVPSECLATSRRPVYGVARHKLEKLVAWRLNYWDWRDDLTLSSAVDSVRLATQLRKKPSGHNLSLTKHP